ncbi:hypothetical protein F4819DRAFT_443128, partial [Hypoxylon fuscum]
MSPQKKQQKTPPKKQDYRRGPWSNTEDKLLRDLVDANGPTNWVGISERIMSRSAKQCRERYHQNLKPSLNHSPITADEGKFIEGQVALKGKRWADIARALDNRSDNCVKNWWNGSQHRRSRLSERPAGADNGNATTLQQPASFAMRLEYKPPRPRPRTLQASWQPSCTENRQVYQQSHAQDYSSSINVLDPGYILPPRQELYYPSPQSQCAPNVEDVLASSRMDRVSSNTRDTHRLPQLETNISELTRSQYPAPVTSTYDPPRTARQMPRSPGSRHPSHGISYDMVQLPPMRDPRYHTESLHTAPSSPEYSPGYHGSQQLPPPSSLQPSPREVPQHVDRGISSYIAEPEDSIRHSAEPYSQAYSTSIRHHAHSTSTPYHNRSTSITRHTHSTSNPSTSTPYHNHSSSIPHHAHSTSTPHYNHLTSIPHHTHSTSIP